MCARAQRHVASLHAESLARERWFAEKHRQVTGVGLVDAVEAGDGVLALVDVTFADGGSQRYAIPDGERLWGPLLGRLATGPAGAFALSDAGEGLRARFHESGVSGERSLGRDQSNSSYLLDEGLILKCYRRLQPGPHPEVELVAALTEAGVAEVPALRGVLVWRGDGDWAVALVQEYVAKAEDGWAWVQAELHRWLAGAADLEWAADIGRVTARMHTALAEADRPGLHGRRASSRDVAAWHARAQSGLETAARAEPSVRRLAAAIRGELAVSGAIDDPPLLTRVHGDFHVGQVLRSPSGYHVVDFEGEPTRSLDERRALDSPLRDVASMLRSFDNTARWALRDTGGTAEGWVEGARSAFLAAYAAGVDGSAISVEPVLVRALELEKALYEVAYAAQMLPEWMPVALPALADLLRA